MFDSSSYYSPPDIIFDKTVIVHEAFDVEEQSALQPANNWDLKDENCLYNWFEDLVGRLKKVCAHIVVYLLVKQAHQDSHDFWQPPESASPSPPPQVPPSSRKKKNWGIFNLDDDSDDNLIISKEKVDSDDDFMSTESNRKSRDSNTRNKRPARNQSDETKDTKRPKVIEQIDEFKTHTIIDSDEEMTDISVDSKQVNKSSCVDTDIELKGKGKLKMDRSTGIDKAEPQKRNPYINESSAMNFEFKDEPKESIPKEETKIKPQRNPFIAEMGTFDFDFNDKPKDLESKGEECMTERRTKTEKTKPQKKNPYIDETSTFNFGCDDKPKDAEYINQNPYFDDFEDMEMDKPKAKKPKTIDLMQKTTRLTQSPKEVAAMRMQREAKWGEDFMTLWRRKFAQYVLANASAE